MPLHLKELQKHSEQNEQIIALLTKLTDIQQPKKEVVLNTPEEGVKKNAATRQSKAESTRKRITNSNTIK